MTSPMTPSEYHPSGVAWYLEDDYPAILCIMADRHLFPISWRQWHERAQRGEAEFRAGGVPLVRVMIDPKQFSGWCAVQGENRDTHGRAAYCDAGARRHLLN